jgi:dTDP-glucose 4,6-dehydratase
MLESLLPASANPAMAKTGASSYLDLKTHVADRSGHDRRYAVDASKARRELGVTPARDFDDGLKETVRWYLEHRGWVEAVQRKARYERERLGLDAGRSRS